MTKYVIQSNIPIPTEHKGGRRDPDSFMGKLRTLKVGQSIFKKGSRNSIGASVRNSGAEGKFTSRSVDGGVRVWRIK